MFLATTTANNIFSQFGLVSSSIFDSFFGWLCLIMGLLIAWYIIHFLVGLFMVMREEDKKFDKKISDLIERGNRINSVIKKYEK
jgi:hypothetical protein